MGSGFTFAQEDSLRNLLQQSTSDSVKAQIYNNISKNYERRDPEKSLLITDTAIFYAKRSGNIKQRGIGYLRKGISFKYLGQTDQALEYNFMALKDFEAIGADNLAAGTLVNIGAAYWQYGDLTSASNYYQESQTKMESLNDRMGMASLSINLGILSAIDSNYVDAEVQFNTGLKLYRELGDSSGVARILGNKSQVYQIKGEFDKSFQMLNQSRRINEALGDQWGLIHNMISLSDLAHSMGDKNKQLRYLEAAARMADSTVYVEVISSTNKNLSNLYERNSNFEKALLTFKKHIKAKDSLFSLESESRIADLESVYQNEQKAKEIEVLNKNAQISELKIQQNEATIAKDRYPMYGLGVGLILFLAIAIISIYSYINKKKSNQLIASQKERIDRAYLHLEEKNNEILDSISYARRI